MDCQEARSLIRTGAVPGAGEGRIPQLGFHLSVCPACRAFRRIDAFDRQAARAARRVPTPRRRRSSFHLGRLSVQMARATGLLLLVVLTGAGWYLGLPLVRAWSNVAAMTDLELTASDLELPIGLKQESTPPLLISKAALPLPKLAVVPSATDEPARMFIGPPIQSVTSSHDVMVTSTPAMSIPAMSMTTVMNMLTPVDVAPVLPEEVPDVQVDPATGAITILVLGTDARPDEKLARSDAIMLVRLDPEHQAVTLLSLPRDLWVPIPNFGEGKIDTAYFLGEQYDEGAAVAAQTISEALAINIDRTAVVDFEGFRSLIDALGGIRINVPTELYDPEFPTEDYGYTVAHFLPGEQIMDGAQALMYSRIRHPDSDFERMRRQQAVVVGIAERLRERGVLKNLREADRITAALRPYIHTDLPRPLALNLLWSMRSVDVRMVKRITADTSLLTETYVGDAYALIAEPSTLHDLGAQLVAAP